MFWKKIISKLIFEQWNIFIAEEIARDFWYKIVQNLFIRRRQQAKTGFFYLPTQLFNQVTGCIGPSGVRSTYTFTGGDHPF